MMIQSVRWRVSGLLHAEQRGARKHGAQQPPWPTGLRRAVRFALHLMSSVRGLASLSALGLGVLLAICYLFSGAWGPRAATTGLLSVLWQVQAGSVSLALALAIFVFGLLPQARGRVSYREFLRRSGALPIVVFGVGSMVFDGVVLLGIGHQVRASSPGAGDGHGLAVSVAIGFGLASIASIGLLFGLTIQAIDPGTAKSAQDTYRLNVLAQALYNELHERACIEFMQQRLGGTEPMFRLDRFVHGRRVESSRSSALVRDVSLWRLRALRRYAMWRGRQQPVIHCWPGKHLIAGTSGILLTIDPRSWPLTRVWARCCVQVRSANPDRFGQALDALHAETLDEIRADRPLEALSDTTATGDLLDVVWRAYNAHGRTYDHAIEQAYWPTIWPTIAVEITGRIYTQARAAVISQDEELRTNAARQPRLIACRALQAQAGASVNAALEIYEGIYGAVIDDLKQTGGPWPPADGLARRRINAAIQPLVSFIAADVGDLLNSAIGDYERAEPEARRAALNTARDTVRGLAGANERVLGLLRRAIQAQDTPTVRNVLAHWSTPGDAVFHTLFAQTVDPTMTPGRTARDSPSEVAVLQDDLLTALDAARDQLDAMRLRLLMTAMHRDWKLDQNDPSVSAGLTAQGGPPGSGCLDAAARGRDPLVETILSGLPSMRLWHVLPAALEQAQQRDLFHHLSDGEFTPSGVVVIGDSQPVTQLIEVFILALLVRPDLIDDTPPSAPLALQRGDALRSAATAAVTHKSAWLERYGVIQDEARQRSGKIIKMITRIEQEALDAQAEPVINAPIKPENTALLQTSARDAFAQFDILGKVLTWAGRPPSPGASAGNGSQPLAVTATIPREDLTATDPDLSNLALEMGRCLAKELLLVFLKRACDEVALSEVNAEQAGPAIEATIGQLHVTPAPEISSPTSPSKIIVLIPVWTQLRESLDLTDAESNPPLGPGTRRREKLNELGLSHPDTQWLLAGLLGDTPVLQIGIGALKDKAIIVDLSRFAQLELTPSSQSAATGPRLTIDEPDHAEVTSAVAASLAAQPQSGNQSAAEPVTPDMEVRRRIRETMLRVGVTLTLDAQG
jgi:hypothetical protein